MLKVILHINIVFHIPEKKKTNYNSCQKNNNLQDIEGLIFRNLNI